MAGENCFEIRRLQQADVRAVLDIIGSVRREYQLQQRVQAVLEPSDYSLFDIYRRRRSAYFVAVEAGEVVGGAGIAPLTAGDWLTCELQRMYLRPQYRGRHIGRALLHACVDAARLSGFERCYAETISEMTTAIAFYQRQGFGRLATPIGHTGHDHNDCWMMLELRTQHAVAQGYG